jgi:hypothetical protein
MKRDYAAAAFFFLRHARCELLENGSWAERLKHHYRRDEPAKYL